ncbi:hypothetical protein GLOIN_2v1494565 [Rhizophagus irregularis DAOM 181602=DAOM 197198]|uniref:Uncharacterized protein n=1 Tax=Rhizophagus irregularis (strain DAOM 181602 / DAOM 197198 / MUCL 43194) TaxID=747089 RepID=A0A2P4QZ08_RHIID|nr:hypothetical protein GLOIN_2v1494565 [Rhizophagus irregularis DAOM 181602=DAOM 197198]POG82877.1 hypothetical protein GLOIN_2v1494565 [Rhizophagus irregularis DAOM 181602=DAOM 197198]|eukprot:XP_025189743.1 hypothetical protein GLOIN_2v1494565 [Rhizophagus irregularis DAOM 181602=DAOM 197198]
MIRMITIRTITIIRMILCRRYFKKLLVINMNLVKMICGLLKRKGHKYIYIIFTYILYIYYLNILFI